MVYRKIPKISPGAYIFQRLFLRGLFLVGLISTEGNLRFKHDWASLINGRKFTVFTLYLRAISEDKPPGGLHLEGGFDGGCLRYEFGGLTFGGAYFRNFTVYYPSSSPEISHCYLKTLLRFLFLSGFLSLDVEPSKTQAKFENKNK